MMCLMYIYKYIYKYPPYIYTYITITLTPMLKLYSILMLITALDKVK